MKQVLVGPAVLAGMSAASASKTTVRLSFRRLRPLGHTAEAESARPVPRGAHFLLMCKNL